MKALINTTTAVIGAEKTTAVNARDLWIFLESKQEFANWIKARIREYGFTDGVDFTVDKIINGKNKGRFSPTEYLLSLDMAKELAMVENNVRGKQARRYFIEVEKELRRRDAAGNPAEIAEALIPVIRENERLRARYEIARQFLPSGAPGELNKAGVPKTRWRRGYYCSGYGNDLTALVERPEHPGLFDEITLKRIAEFGKHA